MPCKFHVKKEYRVPHAVGNAHRARPEDGRNKLAWAPALSPICIDHRTNLAQL